MSATNRSDARIKDDRYMTPPELARVLVGKLLRDRWIAPGAQRVLEPHAGNGAFVRQVRRVIAAAHITANDTTDDVSRWYSQGADEARVGDFLGLRDDFDLVVGNPPYAVAEAHVRHALQLATGHRAVVAFLLRLGFLESRERIAFWREHPASGIYVLSERPSFTGGATDQTSYAWFVWRKDWLKPTELRVLSWKGDVK